MSTFEFKYFSVSQANSALKVGTDSMLLGALTTFQNPQRLLDIGAGTGVLSLMCAQRYACKEIHSVEMDKQALIDCEINLKKAPFSSIFTIHDKSFQEFCEKANDQFDAIISNPPFFENSLRNENHSKAIARHTDSLTFEELYFGIQKLLSPNGKCALILPYQALERWVQLTASNKLKIIELVRVYAKENVPSRLIIHLAFSKEVIIESSLVVRNDDNSYTDQYKKLTIDFHNRAL